MTPCLRAPKNIKKKNNKQTSRTNIIREIDIKWRVFSGEGEGKNAGEGTGNKKHNQ